MRRLIPLSIFIFCAVFTFSGCQYEEPPPSEINLVDRLVWSHSSLEYFSFDLNSSLMIPYLTEFNKHPFDGNIVSAGSNTNITIPLCPLRPEALAIKVHSNEIITGKTYLKIFLNNESLGFIGAGNAPTVKRFDVKPSLWNPSLNQISIRLPKGNGTIVVDNLWLIPKHQKQLSGLETGNHFTSLVAFPVEGIWNSGLFLSSNSSLTIPVQLPLDQVFFHCETLSSSSRNLLMFMKVTSAGKFGRKTTLNTDIQFRQADQWLPVKWDISELAGQFTAFHIENRGESPVLLRNIYIRTF